MRRPIHSWMNRLCRPTAGARGRRETWLALETLEERAVPSSTSGSGSTLPGVSGAEFVVTGDFNRDGKIDVAVGESSAVLVYSGKGDGTFSAPTSSAPPQGVFTNAVVADFDGKNGPDIAVATTVGLGLPGSQTSVSILFNNGDNTFTEGKPLGTFDSPGVGLAVADFDGKNGPDLAMGQGAVTVLLNNGDGTFASPTAYDAGIGSGVFTTADFDRKNGPDIAIAGTDSSGAGGSVTVLLNKGDGTFDTATSPVATGVAPTGIAAADFDAKNGPDLAISGSRGPGEPGAVAVFLNQGDATLVPAPGAVNLVASPSASATPQSIRVADLTGDGIPDIATANSVANTTQQAALSLLVGKGDGTFFPAQNPDTGMDPPRLLDVGDFNGDRAVDLAAGGNSVAIFLSVPGAVAVSAVSTPTGAATFAVREDHSVYKHDASGWHPVGLGAIEAISVTSDRSGTPMVFATTQGHDLFLLDTNRGLINTGLRFIRQLSATTDATGNPVLFVVTDAHDLFEFGPGTGLVNPHLSFIDQISATTDSAGNPVVFAITQGHDLFSFGATLGLRDLQSKFLTAISATRDKTTGQAALYALTQGHDLVYNDGLWHNLNSKFIQQISAGTGPAGQPEVAVITQSNDLLRFDNQRGWVLLNPPRRVSDIQALDQDRLAARGSDASVLQYDGTGWIDLGFPR